MEDADRRYMSRKFALAAAAFLSGLGLFVFGRLTPDQWMSFTTWVVGMYLGANVADQAVTR